MNHQLTLFSSVTEIMSSDYFKPEDSDEEEEDTSKSKMKKKVRFVQCGLLFDAYDAGQGQEGEQRSRRRYQV